MIIEKGKKLMWSKQDLKGWAEATCQLLQDIEARFPILPEPPWAKIRVPSMKTVKSIETVKEDTVLHSFNIRFVMGLMGLVGVRLDVQEQQLLPEPPNRYYRGDDQYIQCYLDYLMNKGYHVAVIIINDDPKYDHYVNVRLEVE